MVVWCVLVATLFTAKASHAAPNADGEDIPRNEAAATSRIVSLIRDTVTQGHTEEGRAHRDAHRKAHGCVKATFEVLPGLNSTLAVGVFAKPATYPATIRFSNGSGKSQDDRQGDARGMAIKLDKVPGAKILEDEKDAATQDFLLINSPIFFIRTAADYVALQEAISSGAAWKFFLNPFHLFHEARIAKAIQGKKLTNPLNARYWSTTPYKLGSTQMKYSARPCSGERFDDRSRSVDLLRENMERYLSAEEACFEFEVQVRTNPVTMPIEDPTIEWDEHDAPFVQVARVKIPLQRPEQGEACEILSYTPWHSLPEHRPLGGISRVRFDVYREVSKLRHDLNGQTRGEPSQETHGGSMALPRGSPMGPRQVRPPRDGE
jgi:Catalase